MTQIKLKNDQEEEKKKKIEKSLSSQKPWCLRDNCVKALAWSLLSVGLCIIVITFYMASQQSSKDQTQKFREPEQIENFMFADQDDDLIFNFQFNKTISEAMDKDSWIDFHANLRGCQEIYCRMRCNQVLNIYKELFSTFNHSNCQFMDILVIEGQYFPRGVGKKYWPTASISVRELVLSNSQINRIHNGAFNTPIFNDTFLLSWHKLNLFRVGSGALLGLYSLKYLLINTQLPNLDRAFFQPVQTTLVTLKLNSGLTIANDCSVFGISRLERLEYADLSYNHFSVPITKNMLQAVPNLRHLIITNAKITCIENDAFQNLKGKLLFLNLSKNLFTTISAEVFTPLLSYRSRTYFNLEMNNWNCNCKIREFAALYKHAHTHFIGTLYCKAPHSLYGTPLNEVDFVYCDEGTTTFHTDFGELESAESTSTTTTTTITITEHENESLLSEQNSESHSDSYEASSEESRVFIMHCQSYTDVDSKSLENDDTLIELFYPLLEDRIENPISTASVRSASLPISTTNSFPNSNSLIVKKRNTKDTRNTDMNRANTNLAPQWGHSSHLHATKQDYFEFDPPGYDFELLLLGNHSARVVISDVSVGSSMLISIIWFSEKLESTDSTSSGTTQGYDCLVYASPYVIIDNLEDNTTYTFCLMSPSENTITPFNCLPLHVPAAASSDDNVWITVDNKPFTIGILCLIFALSVFFGAVLAYFGIKNFPDLLEGSKNVLVVKKQEPNCYVSTITEMDYTTQTSFMKKPPQNASVKRKPVQSESPSSTSPPPFSISSKELERLSSLKSSSTLFEDSFPPPLRLPEDEYELPKTFDDSVHTRTSQDLCMWNSYATSPTMPPPLPQRNSYVEDNVKLNT